MNIYLYTQPADTVSSGLIDRLHQSGLSFEEVPVVGNEDARRWLKLAGQTVPCVRFVRDGVPFVNLSGPGLDYLEETIRHLNQEAA
ncbi:MAG: hypothetical protein ACTHJM_15815 [Marmoricola sp.]